MQSDPLYPHLTEVITACPLQAGPLFTTFKDLSLSVEWKDLRVMELPGTGWCAIIGHKRSDDALRAVIPLPLHTKSLKPSSLSSIFKSISNLSFEDLPKPIPGLVADLTDLRRDLAIRRGHPSSTSAAHDDNDNDDNDKERAITGEPGAEDSSELESREIEKETIYMGIVTTDSTVVYYKLTKGIKKPADIPDE